MEATPHVCMDPSVRFPSSWRVHFALGPLSGRKIAEYARAGRYGPQAKNVFTNAALRKRTIAATLCDHCKRPGAKYVWDKYLPKSGHYCPTCRKHFRSVEKAKREAAKEEKQKWLELMAEEYQ